MATIVDADRFRHKASSAGGGDGGKMDDILRRLGVVESLVGELRTDVSAIKAVMPHLSAKADVCALKADLNALETKLIRWMLGTLLAATSLAFTIAKFVSWRRLEPLSAGLQRLPKS